MFGLAPASPLFFHSLISTNRIRKVGQALPYHIFPHRHAVFFGHAT